MRIRAPSERNRSLTRLLAAANANTKLKAYWHAQQVTAQRLGMSDHSWVHLQIVLNSALRIYRLLRRAGVESTIERDYGMKPNDAEVVNTDYQPIRGLYAAGELVGGLFYFNYPGGSGLTSGAVFGRIAGTAAARAGRN